MGKKPPPPKPEELIEKLDEKVAGIKEELEGVLAELKNDVDDKGSKIAEDRKAQEEGFEKLQNEIKEMREEFKVEVKESRDNAMEMQKELREEILGKLEETNTNIEQVQGSLVTGLEEVTSKLGEAGVEQQANVKQLADNLESGELGIALSLESGQKGASLSLESGQMGVSLSLDSLEKKVEDRLQQKVTFLLERLDTAVQAMDQSQGNQETGMTNFRQEMADVLDRVDEINEKMYDFEANKRNNLIFYGIPNEQRETQPKLLQKVAELIKINLGFRRDIVVSKVSRMHTGPEIGGCKPVLVTFEDFNDREDVLRKGGMLKGSSISITEDMSRRVRESRTELRKHMREMKKANPGASCHLQYDKLYINRKCYVWNDNQGEVVEFTPGNESGPSRPASRANSPRKISGGSPLSRSESMTSLDQGDDEKDRRIRELEDTLRKQKELMEILQRKMMLAEEEEERPQSSMQDCEEQELNQ